MKVFDARLRVPFSLIVTGPPASGKTTFVKQLLQNKERMIDHPLDYIVWCYGVETAFIRDFKQNTFGIPITLINELPKDFSSYIIPDQRGLFIIDDLMQAAGDSQSVTDLFCNKLQHTNTSVILLLQNLFYHGKERTTLVRCTHYLAVYRNPMDHTIPLYLAHKLMPRNKKLFLEMFERATSKPYGYIFCDGKSDSLDEARFRTNLFDNGIQIAYIIEK